MEHGGSPFDIKTYHDMSYIKIYLMTEDARDAEEENSADACGAGRGNNVGFVAAIRSSFLTSTH
jgi:hypothetical protein